MLDPAAMGTNYLNCKTGGFQSRRLLSGERSEDEDIGCVRIYDCDSGKRPEVLVC